VSQGLCGTTGSQSAENLLDALRSLRCSGTLVLDDGSGTLILQLAKGQVEASFKLGAYGRPDTTGQSFHLNPHEPADLPQLPARLPASTAPVLRALPRLVKADSLPVGAIDLASLLDGLHRQRFTGALSYGREGESAVALLLEGSIRAAVHEKAGRISSRSEALRVLQRLCQEGGEGHLELEPLDPLIAGPLAALALESSAKGNPGEPFTGLEVDDRGYRFLRHDQPFLCVPSTHSGPARRYALPDAVAERAPELKLPAEPPGWEDLRFALTLRGQDALNPMTELNMEFRKDHGRIGQSVLETLGRGDTIEQAARRLELELSELKPWLERLEHAGLIRARV